MPITQKRLNASVNAGLAIATEYLETMKTIGELLEQALSREIPQESFVRVLRRYVTDAEAAIAKNQAVLSVEKIFLMKNWKRNETVANWKRKQFGRVEQSASLPAPVETKPKLNHLQMFFANSPKVDNPLEDGWQRPSELQEQVDLIPKATAPEDIDKLMREYLDADGNLKTEEHIKFIIGPNGEKYV